MADLSQHHGQGKGMAADRVMIEGSPLQSVYVPATQRSGTATPNANILLRGDSHSSAEDGDLRGIGALTLLHKVKRVLHGRAEQESVSGTILSLLLDWDGRDAILALSQSTLLAFHHFLSLPPSHNRAAHAVGQLLVRTSAGESSTQLKKHSAPTHVLKQLYLSQELLASLRRCLLVSKWLSEIANKAQERLSGNDKDQGEAGSKEDQDSGPLSSISLTDIARLAQHGLALENVLPLAGTTASPPNRPQAEYADSKSSELSGPPAKRVNVKSTSNRSGTGSAASSISPQTLKQRFLPFGEVRPPMAEGEDAVFASALGSNEASTPSQSLRPDFKGHLGKPAMDDDVTSINADDDFQSERGDLDEAIDYSTDEDGDPYEPSPPSGTPGPSAEVALRGVDNLDPADLSMPLLPSENGQGTYRAQASASVDRWLHSWELRLEALLSSAGTLAELCDVLAFFSGTSVAWRWFRRTYISRMAPHLSAFPSTRSEGVLISRRQRYGLERTAVLLSGLCGVLSLILIRIKRNRAKRRRREVARRFRAVMDQMEWREAMQARSLVNSISKDLKQLEVPTGDSPRTNPAVAQLARLTPAQRAFLIYDRALSTLTLHIRWLARERWAGLAETSFMMYEIWRPGVDKEGWEAWSGIASALVRTGRAWSERVLGWSV
ncbi:hypothetical protein OC845_005363 [Tilletia horrida]|nr:hypothetical protein OC845_005363 [Tilletia horrida]